MKMPNLLRHTPVVVYTITVTTTSRWFAKVMRIAQLLRRREISVTTRGAGDIPHVRVTGLVGRILGYPEVHKP